MQSLTALDFKPSSPAKGPFWYLSIPWTHQVGSQHACNPSFSIYTSEYSSICNYLNSTRTLRRLQTLLSNVHAQPDSTRRTTIKISSHLESYSYLIPIHRVIHRHHGHDTLHRRRHHNPGRLGVHHLHMCGRSPQETNPAIQQPSRTQRHHLGCRGRTRKSNN